MTRKFLAMLLLLAAVATACSEPGRSPPPRKILPQEEAPRTLKIVAPKGLTFLDALTEGFRQEHSNVTIEMLPLDTSSRDAQSKSYAAGDVVLFNPATPPDGLLDLRPYTVRDRMDDAAYGTALDVLESKGSLAGLPIRAESLMLLYNKEMTEAAGVTIPADGWTWDEFRAAAAHLAREGLPAMGNNQNGLLLDLYIEQKTGRPAWETDAQTLTEALTFFHTLIHTDRSLAPYTGHQRDGANPLAISEGFKGGEVALSGGLQGQVKLAQRAFAVELAPVPHHSPSKRLTLGFIDALGITDGASDPELAWKFVAYAAGPEGAEKVAKAGFLPVYRTIDTRFVPLRVLDGEAVKKKQALDRAASRVFAGSASVEAAVADWRREVGD